MEILFSYRAGKRICQSGRQFFIQRLRELNLIPARIGDAEVATAPRLLNNPLQHLRPFAFEFRKKFIDRVRENVKRNWGMFAGRNME